MKKKFIKAAATSFIALTALSSCMDSTGGSTKNNCGKHSCNKNDCGKNSCKKAGGQVEKSWWQR
ncbi:MAG: hypothetical protein K0T99_00410 [Alphaproteobacteria bacterium]|nr:hypothetical protein [Alphaproteobacteria bacterium]